MGLCKSPACESSSVVHYQPEQSTRGASRAKWLTSCFSLFCPTIVVGHKLRQGVSVFALHEQPGSFPQADVHGAMFMFNFCCQLRALGAQTIQSDLSGTHIACHKQMNPSPDMDWRTGPERSAMCYNLGVGVQG